MKLHLPKMLRTALIAAVCAPGLAQAATLTELSSVPDPADSSQTVIRTDADGNKLYNVGCAVPGKQPYMNGYTTHEGMLTLSGHDKLGVYDTNGDFHSDGFDSIKVVNGTVTENGTVSNSLEIKNVGTVKGTLTLEDYAQVNLGGQYRTETSNNAQDEYTGLKAHTLIVKGYATLTVGRIDLTNLTASGNAVVTSHGINTGGTAEYTSGNNLNVNKYLTNMVETLKMSSVSGTLELNDRARVTFGVDNGSASSDKGHWLNSLGGKIIQNSAAPDTANGLSVSELYIKGKTFFSGALDIKQTGGKMEIGLQGSNNAYTLTYLKSATGNKIHQEGDGSIAIGKMTRYESSIGTVASSQLIITQEGTGDISLINGVTFTTKNASTASSITQTGGGKVNLTGNFTSAIFNVDVTKGLLILTNSSTKLKSNELSVGSGSVTKNGDDVSVEGAFIDNNGIMNVGTGTGGSKAGGLYVTTGGTLNATLDGSKAALHVVSSTNDYGITAWTMSEGSVFGIGLTDDSLSKNATATQGSDSTYTLVFENVLVAEGAVELTDLKNSFCLGNMDDRLWSLAENSATWSQSEDKSKTYVNGTLVFDSTIEITEGGNESNSFSDVTDKNGQKLQVNLAISEKDVTLSGDNDYSGTTSIDGVTVTLDHENALGKSSSITTKGEAGLATTEGVTANLSSAITIEEGDGNTLSIEGSYKADDSITLAQKEQAEAWFDAKGGTGNGFYRAASTEAYEVVKGVTDGNLTVKALDDVLVTIGDKEYQLYSDGLAGEKLDYSTYFIKGAHDIMASEILAANDTDTDTEKVVMEHADGTLTADTGIEVQSTAGTLVTTGEETIVTGSLKDTAITAKGGEIAADISGTSAISATAGTTTLSGDNSYTGGTTIDNAELIVTTDGGLGTGDVVLQNQGTLDLGNKAISNNILVKDCTLRGGAAYTGDMVVEAALALEGNTTAKSVTLTKNGSLSGGPLTTSTLDVQTGGTTSVAGDLTILNGGCIILSDGSTLDVSGSLTLAGATTLKLSGAYSAGTTLASASTLTTGAITLDYSDPTLELEQIGNTLVLVSKFKQDKADALAQGNWGIVTASRAFVNTVRGQRNNTGCIANGKGTAWFSLLGASNNLKGGDVSVDGAAVGADMKVGKCSVLGVAFGYTDGTVSPTGLRKVEQDGYYTAIYGEHGLRKLSKDSCLSLDWVAAYGTTESHQGDLNWEQDSLQLNARINWNKQVNNRLGVTAFAGVEYFASESADAEGARSGSIQNLRGELGVGVSYVAWGAAPQDATLTGTSGCRNLVLHGELRYFNDMVRSNPVVEMSGIRGMGTNPGRQGFGVEAGATFRINERWTTSANYSFDAMEDSQEHRVNVGASYSF